jgi:hypothetical protein
VSSLLGTIGARLGAVGGAAVGFGVGHGVSPAIRPVVQDLANEAWQAHTVRPLDAGLAAQLVAEGFWTLEQGAGEASMQGYNGERFSGLVRDASRGPTIEQALEGARRGLLETGELTSALEQAGVRPEWRGFIRQLTARVLSAEQAATMVIRGVLTDSEGAEIGRRNGYDADTFAALVRVTGNPPGPMDLLDLWNRGEIAEADVERGLRQSNLKPEWFETFKALRYFIPSVSDLVRFAVREVFTPSIRSEYGLDDDFPADFEREGAKRGLSGVWARAYWAAHWELPSIEQGYRMLHRGEITEAQLDTLLRTKDVMPYWRERLKAIAHLVPGRVDLRRMFRAGTIDRSGVLEGYKRLGYTPEDAELLTTFAEDEARDAATRGSLVPAYRRRVVAAAAREYVARQLSEAEARSAMSAIGIPARTQDQLVPLWNLERDLLRRELTIPEIVKAHKNELLTEPEALAELIERGLSEGDAQTRLQSG